MTSKKILVNGKLKCTKCDEFKLVDEFPKNKKTYLGVGGDCKSCRNSYKKIQYSLDPKIRQTISESSRKWHLSKKYQLTIEDYNSLVAEQNNRCAICFSLFNLLEGRKPPVDHCHSTGKIRGLLCRNCNLGLGNFLDNPEFLMNAIFYLKEYN